MKKRIVLQTFLVLFAGLSLSACLIVARPHPMIGVTVYEPPLEYGYQPMLYDGYVVYYTDDGVPFYWAGGARVWVPINTRARYIDHWRHHDRAYRHWYNKRGHYYKSRRYRGRGHALKKAEKHKLKKAKRAPELKPVKKHKLKKVEEHRLIPVD
ncbi:MAG TPA: hypothetical protein VM425_03465 [Myxococcota bacterium]|nr:hypothetical protein [Myxococcota bacterium]